MLLGVDMLVEKWENEFGLEFVRRALGYITISDGIALGELEDVFSCDDVLLESLNVTLF